MNTNKRMTAAIMLALVIWGVYLAIGSTGYFLESSLWDARKSLIVVVCMTSFLALWVFVLRAVEKRKLALQTPPSPDSTSKLPNGRPWSKAGLATLAIGGLGAVVWAVSIASFKQVGLATTTCLGWFAAASMVGAATAGMVALSNPRALRGKWLGFTGLVLCGVSLIGFVVRMTP